MLTCPQTSALITNAANTYVSVRPDTVLQASVSTDSIIFLRLCFGVPMFAYKGVANYIRPYHNRSFIGSHLYEGASGDARDNRMLPDIYPISLKSEANWTETERVASEQYTRALESGIISRAGTGTYADYHLNTIDQDILRQWTAEVHAALNKAKPLREKVFEQYLYQELPIQEYAIIHNNGILEYEQSVIRDHVMGSPIYMNIMQQQLKAIEEYRSEFNRLRLSLI